MGGVALFAVVVGVGTAVIVTLLHSPPTKAHGQPGRPGPVAARVGDIEVVDPFVPAPASPSVGAFYAEIVNLGDQPDALVAASSPVAATAMPMSDNSSGSMTALPRLVVPAHGTAALSPGHDHLMLEDLKGTLVSGQTVKVVLRFERAGSVTVTAPVVPLSRLLESSR